MSAKISTGIVFVALSKPFSHIKFETIFSPLTFNPERTAKNSTGIVFDISQGSLVRRSSRVSKKPFWHDSYVTGKLASAEAYAMYVQEVENYLEDVPNDYSDISESKDMDLWLKAVDEVLTAHSLNKT